MRATKPLSIAMSVVLAVGLCPMPVYAADDSGPTTTTIVVKDDAAGSETDLPSALDNLAAKEKALDAAESANGAATEALADAQAALEEADAAKSAADQAAADAQADKASADETKASAQEQADSAAQALEAAQESATAADKDKADAQQAVTEAAASLESDKAANEGAQAALAQAEETLAAAQGSLDEATAAFEEAKSAGVEITNSRQFFEAVGSADAVLALDEAYYKDYTDLASSTDATAIANMRKTFQFLRECNAIRAELGLGELLVTDTLMAIAQSNLNWSDTAIAHSQQFNVGENLSWGSGDNAYVIDWETADPFSNPFEGWFDQERLVWLDALAQNPDYENMTPAQLNDVPWKDEHGNDSTLWQCVGHYMNIIDAGTRYTGFAFSADPGNVMQALAYCQVFQDSARPLSYNNDKFSAFSNNAAETAYTVDDYEKRFEETVAVPLMTDEQRQVYDAAKEALDAAQEAYDEAASDAGVKREEAEAAATQVAQSEQQLAYLNEQLAEATSIADEAAKALAEAQGANDAAQEALAEANEQAAAADEALAKAQKEAQEAEEAAEAAASEVEKATAQAASAAEALKAAQDEFVAATVAARDAFEALAEDEQEAASEELATIEAAEDRAGIKRAGDIRSADIAIADQEYTGEAIEPEISVTFGDEVLEKGVDYEVVFENNVEVGTATAKLTGIGEYRNTKTVSFEIAKADLSKMTATLSQDRYTYDGDPKIPDLTITAKNGKVLEVDVDYEIAYENNVEIGTARVVATGIGNYEGTLEATYTISINIQRLWGMNALDTMSAIVNAGSFERGGTVVLATFNGYHDALTAAGVAGLANAPVLMTDKSTLSSQTRAEIEYLKPKTIIICGGSAAVEDGVAYSAAVAAGGAHLERFWGNTATGTAANIYRQAEAVTGGSWSHMAFICTNDGYWDALAAAPISYTLHMPIFLTEGANDISEETINAMKGDITNFYIVGGPAAVSDTVRGKLVSQGFTYNGRLGGSTAVETSEWVAGLGLSSSQISANTVGIATLDGYYDALSGAAFCGQNKGVLLLTYNPQSHSIAGTVSDAQKASSVYPFTLADRADQISNVYIFGGTMAVSKDTEAAIASALR